MMDAVRPTDEERAHDTDKHSYVEVQKPDNGQVSATAQEVTPRPGTGSPPTATTVYQAGRTTMQISRAQLERDMETSEQFRKEALRSRRFVDAARYQMMIWKFRHNLSGVYPFPIHEKLDLCCQLVDILLECDELHSVSFPREADEQELEQNAHRLDPRKWGELCAGMGLLYMRWTSLQDLDKAKRYLQLALTSLAKLDSYSGMLLPISQDLADVYSLQGDLAGAQQYFKGDVSVDIGRMDRVRAWCESHRFKAGRFNAQDVKRGISPLQLATKQQDVDVFEAMFNFTKRVVPRDTMTSISSNLLLFVAATNNVHSAALLIDAGANVDALDEQGRSALHRCQSCPENGSGGGIELARLLLGKKTSLINHQDREGKTALIMACEAGHAPMAELLLEHGSDPSVRDMHGKTCLYTACEKGDLDMARILLRATADQQSARGLDINARGPGGCTPIIMAVRAASANRRKVSIVKELMRHDADPNIQDHRGNDAFQYVTGLAARDIEQALGEPGTEEHASSGLFSQRTRTRSQSMSDHRIEEMPACSLPPGHASAAVVPKRNRAMSLWGLAQSGSKVSLAPSFSTHNSSSGFRSIFSRRSSSSRSTALSTYTRDTPTVPSLLEADEDARSCNPSDCDEADSHEPSSPGPTQPRRSDGQGQWPYGSGDESEDGSEDESEHESKDEPDVEPVGAAKKRHSQEHCSSSSSNNDDPPTPSVSDVASGRLSNEYGGSEPPVPDLHRELPIRPSAFHGNFHQVGSGARQHANQNSSSGGSLPSGMPGAMQGHNNTPSRGGRDPGRPGGRSNARRRGAAVRAAQEDSAPADKYFACPFAKHNFFRHPDCTSYCGKRVRDVKQHIRRAHYHPYYCSRCYEVFASSGERDAHTRVMSCSFRQERKLDSITGEQDEMLARQCPSHMNNDYPAQWYYMFGIIFPGQPQPASPYVDFDPYLVCDSLKQFTREHAVQHAIGRAGQLACWDAHHLSAIVDIVNSLVDDFCNSLQPRSPLPTFDPHTPESLGNPTPLNEMPIPGDGGNIELQTGTDHFQISGGHAETPIPMPYKDGERGVSPELMPQPDYHWGLVSAPAGQAARTRTKSHCATADHSSPIERSGCFQCTPISMLNVPEKFSPQQFELPNVGYDPAVRDNIKASSIPMPSTRSPTNPDPQPPTMSLAIVPENIPTATTSLQDPFFFSAHDSSWYETQTPYDASYFGQQDDTQASMVYSAPQQTRIFQQPRKQQAHPGSLEDDVDAWARLTPSDYSN